MRWLGSWGRKKKPKHWGRRLLLQWHVTDRCNLRCAHCYQEQWNGAEPDVDALVAVLGQFGGLLNDFERRFGGVARGHINVTGGEPFLRADFLDLLKMFRASSRLSYAILTNGSMIDREMAKELRRLGPQFVQVSIEGIEATHDGIRGNGNFERTLGAIRNLVRAGVPTLIAFTAHRANYREFPEVARLGSRLGVTRVWADRMVPVSGGLKLETLSREETQEFIDIIAAVRREIAWKWLNRTEVAMHRALQFLAGGHPYHCTAGDTLVTVMPNGDVYPCRRMPIRAGNVMKESLVDIYWDSPVFRNLRNRNRISDECGRCTFGKICRGGSRCLSYAVHGDPFARDPGCWVQ